MSRAVAIIMVVIWLAVLSLPVSGSSHVFDVRQEGTAVGRGGHYLRGERSLPLTPPLLRGNPDLRDFREADGGDKAVAKAEGVVIGNDENGDGVEAPVGHEKAAGVFEALQGELDREHDMQGDNEGSEDQDQDRIENESTSPNDASGPRSTALASVAAIAIASFGCCFVASIRLWIEICVCKRQDGREDGVIRATAFDTLAPVVCDSYSVGDDGEARPASQPCTPQSSSAGKPSPDKAARDVDDGNIITPFVFRRTLKAVVVTPPTSHGGSECCQNECTVDVCSKRREPESTQVVGSSVGNVEEGKKGGPETTAPSPDLPRAEAIWRVFAEINHALVMENHRRSTQRHLAVFNMVPPILNPPTCSTPSMDN